MRERERERERESFRPIYQGEHFSTVASVGVIVNVISGQNTVCC